MWRNPLAYDTSLMTKTEEMFVMVIRGQIAEEEGEEEKGEILAMKEIAQRHSRPRPLTCARRRG